MNVSNNNDSASQEPIGPRPEPNPNPSSARKPRGFAASAMGSAGSEGGGKGKREREREKERTKLRERHRRAITSRMLAGLRQYGNFPLPARADMNDVLAALAREAGWTVEADGTTYRHSPPPHQMATFQGRSGESRLTASSLKSNTSARASLDCQHPVLRIDESLSPVSLDSVVIAESDMRSDRYTSGSPIDSVECLETDQLIQDVRSGEHGNDFTSGAYVAVYVKLSAGIISAFCRLADPEGIRQELRQIKSLNVDGVVVDCWWGIVENWGPRKYVWSAYRELFNIIREFRLKLQVVLAFHEHGGANSGGIPISLPQWVLEIGNENPDIFFTDREGGRNTECLSWGIDKERVLNGRTGIEVYFDFMRSFHAEFEDLFADGLVTGVEIGLGANGELKYPSFSERMGWTYPGIGEFQCYDKYLLQSLEKAAGLRGHSFWAKGPDNAGRYSSRPHETGFFCERGDYGSCYGRFFLSWYSKTLIEHADNILSLASLAFEDSKLIVKVPSIYWWYRTTSHAAELTAGYYNSSNRDGYSPLVEVLKKHSATVKLVCSDSHLSAHGGDEALSDPQSLSWQVLNAAWDKGLTVAGENAILCFNRDWLIRIIDMAKSRHDPDHRHFSFFVYQQPSPLVQGAACFPDLDYFVRCMHGEIQEEPFAR